MAVKGREICIEHNSVTKCDEKGGVEWDETVRERNVP